MASGPFDGKIVLTGLKEATGALRQIDRKLPKLITEDLRKAAEPVAPKATSLAVGRIRNIGSRWSGMRIGATGREVYVVPRARRRGGSPRPNLGALLLEQSMLPAVESLLPEITSRVEDALDRITSEF